MDMAEIQTNDPGCTPSTGSPWGSTDPECRDVPRAVVEFLDVHKRVRGKEVLCGLNLDVREGEVLILIGRSVTGRSVLLKHIVGLHAPDAGRVVAFGRDLSSLSKREMCGHRECFGYLFQGAALLRSLSVFDNIALPLREAHRLAEKEVRERVEQSMQMVGLNGAGDMYPSDLSAGMAKRAALARMVVRRPRVILYDEPTAGLDPIMAQAINDLICVINRQLGATSVVGTHDMRSAFQVGERMAMLYQGRIVKQGPCVDFREADDPIVRQFVSGATEGDFPDHHF